jgi:GNAT superfamily N-acetyltransferase
MSAVAENAVNSINALVARRWQEADPLLPEPLLPPPGCDAPLIVAGPGAQPAAVGSCVHWARTADSLDVALGAARRFQLTAIVAGPDVRDALDQLLSQWRDHLAGTPGANDDDSAAIVNWPSRDIEGVETLVHHGFSPLAVLAARATGRHPGGPADRPASRPDGDADPAAGVARRGITIRRAGPADLEAVVRLGLEVIRFDAYFGNGGERPGTVNALRREVVRLLDAPQPWTWLAERDRDPVGLLAAQPPRAAAWIAPMVRPTPAAYLMLMFVQPGDRGSGVGADLVARLHREIDATGVPVTLLHYQTLNPLSPPFWHQQGYRPLWVTWEARPARSIR